MHALSRMQRWVIVVFGLPIVAMVSTFVVSQTQISRLMPADMPVQSSIWGALQLSLASGLLWLLWRETPQLPDWRALGRAIVEGVGLFGAALSIGWYSELIDVSWQLTYEHLLRLLVIAVPLAWWSMAEERLLRVELSQLLAQRYGILRDVSMLIVGWIVQMSMLAPYGFFVFIVVILTEGLSVVTWSGSADFNRTWARRWAWRWLIVGGTGLSSTGFVLGMPSPLTITSDDPFVLVILVAATMIAWVSYSSIQQYTRKQ